MIATSFAVALNSITNISSTITSDSLLDTYIKRFLSRLEELMHLFTNLSYCKGISTITSKASQLRSTVQSHNIPLLENSLMTRNAVYDLVVYGYTHATGKTLITKECWRSTMIAYELFCTLIKRLRRDSWSDYLSNLCERATNKLVRSAHKFYFFVCLEINHNT